MTKPSETTDVIVVGAGHNGLIAASYLARAGKSVQVLEQRPFVGGACVTEELIPGYRFSTCAGVCWKLQRKIVDDLALEKRVRHVRLDPDPINLYGDALALPVWSDQERTSAEISRFDSRDGDRYPGWEKFWNLASQIVDGFLLRPPPSFADLEEYAETLGASDVLSELRQRSLAEICERFFDDPRIQAAFVNVDDVGDPWSPGGALLEAYFQRQGAFGGAFIMGGMGRLTEAIADVARELGVAIRVDRTVKRILIGSDQVEGVELTDGKCVRAPIVISNADPMLTTRLVGSDVLYTSTDQRGTGLQVRAACLKFHGVLNGPPDLRRYFAGEAVPPYGQLRIGGANLDQFRRADDLALHGEMSPEPVLFLHLPTPHDPSLTFDGGQCVSAFVRNAPSVLASGDWQLRKAEIGQQIVDYIDEFVPGFRSSLREYVVLTPDDIQQRVGLTNGNIHHTDMIPSQLFDRRTSHRTQITGLFLCGAGTHPGGEVTGAPGYNAARSVLGETESRP